MIQTVRIKLRELDNSPPHRDSAILGIADLADDIARNGVITKPVITIDRVILDGERVIEALRMLGDTWVTVEQVDTIEDAVNLLNREGVDKEPLTIPKSVPERLRLGEKLHTFDRLAYAERRSEAIRRGRAQGASGQRRHITSMIAPVLGWSGTTYGRMRLVWRHAYGEDRQPPEIRQLARYLVDQVDKGHIGPHYARVRLGEALDGMPTTNRLEQDLVEHFDDEDDIPDVDPGRIELAERQARLAGMHHRTRSRMETEALRTTARFSDQLATIPMTVGALVDGGYPIGLLPTDGGEVASLKRNLTNAKRALNKLSRALRDTPKASKP